MILLVAALGLAREPAPSRRPCYAGSRRRPRHAPAFAGNPLVALRVVLRAGSQDDPPEGGPGRAHGRDGRRGREQVADLRARSSRLSTRWPRTRRVLLQGDTVFSGVVHRDNLAAYTRS